MVRHLRVFWVPTVLVAATVALIALTGMAANASSSSVTMFVAGQVGGAVRAVVADGETAWVGEGIGVSRVDIRNPDFLRLMGHTVVAEGADVWSLARSGDWLFVGGTDGLHVLDIRDPAAPLPVGRMPTDQTIRALTAVSFEDGLETWLFAVAPQFGAMWIEILPDGSPRPAFSVAGTVGATGPVAVDGTWAVAPGDDAHVIDISDPARPMEVAVIVTPGRVRGVDVRDGLAYLSDSEGGMSIWSIGAHPTEVGRLSDIGPGRPYVNGDYVHLLEQGPRGTVMRLIDVSDPTSPTDPLGGESTYEVLHGTMDLVSLGTRLVAARGAELSVADITSVLWPQVKDEYRSTWPLLQLAETGGCIYAAKGPSGLDVVDARYPEGSNVVLSWRPPGGTFGVHTFERDAFLSMNEGMARFDVRDACDPIPREVPFGHGWGVTRAIDTGGNRVVAASPQRLCLAELGGDEAPREITQAQYQHIPGWPDGAIPRDVALYQGGAALIATAEAGMVIVNLLNGEAPSVHRIEVAPEGLAVLSLTHEYETLAVGTSGGLLIYDLHDPFNPELLGSAPGQHALVDVAIRDGRVYAAGGVSGLLVYDISDPETPGLAGTFQPPYPITALTVGQQFVHAAGAGVITLHVSPSSPQPTATPRTATPPLPAVPTATPGATRPPPATTRPPASATGATPSATTPTPTGGPLTVHTFIPLAMK